VLFVEVLFLYREFVDALAPWLAQQSENFELGIFWTLAISTFAWFGIRSVSWFLFASHGTPAIMSVIQGKGLKLREADAGSAKVTNPKSVEFTSDFMKKIKADTVWIEEKGEVVLGSFILPPLQVVAATINFFTLLISSSHLFELPFKDFASIMDTKALLKGTPAKPKIKKVEMV
jgi:hypothetical protein